MNYYIRHRGPGNWVIISKRTGRTLSKHTSRAKAQASFRAMEAKKHTDKRRRRRTTSRRK